MPWCWRCGTASSKHDIVTEGYKEVTHSALFMQFPLKENPDEYFLIFTTTPWTVPANVAIAVNPNLDYIKVDNDGVKYWLAEARVSELEGKYKILEKKKGKELRGKEYVMPYFDFEQQKNSPHKVVLWDLASGEEGTGIVHIAPGCGAEDFDLGKKENLPAICPLDSSGVYSSGFGEFSLKKYDAVNKEVLHDLEQRRFVYKIVPYKHRYPHCWRCGEELVFRLVEEWYINCKEIKEKLIKENNKINWFPEYGKLRQGEWFKNMGDWLISRKRYWGLPLPIWECSCGQIEVIGSLEELKNKATDKKKVENLKEIHRPWIDEIKIKCPKCGKEVSRILDVGDAWLDAGIVPFSTLNYLTDRKYWQAWFPADFICENMPGQYRGWFNALFWASVALTGKAPFKSILGYETLKDEKGEEMHKSKGNAIWFDDAINKIGADVMRLIYCLQDPAQELRFGFNIIREPQNSISILYNTGRLIERTENAKIKNIEDKLIISKLNSLIKIVTKELESLHPHQATRALQDFWLNDLSRGYIQLVRDRIAENDKEVRVVLQNVFVNLLKLIAPIMPFITEKLWQELRQKKIVEEESIHLCDWPKFDEKKIDLNLEKEFDTAVKILEAGFAERDKAKIGLRWPLASAKIECPFKISKELQEIIARQLNVKKIELLAREKMKVSLDIVMNQELEAEGFSREFARKVQAERKNKGLVKSDVIALKINCNERLKKMFKKNLDFLKERVNAKNIEFADGRSTKENVSVSIKGFEISFSFS